MREIDPGQCLEEGELPGGSPDRLGRRDAAGDGRRRPTPPPQQKRQVLPEPLTRLGVIPEPALVRVEAAVVGRPAHVVEVLVIDHRLDEKPRDVGGVEQWMNPDDTRRRVIRPEPDTPSPPPADLLSPSDERRPDVGEVLPPDLGGEELEVVEVTRRQRKDLGHALVQAFPLIVATT
jgi:hypothetical protein